ncbi:dorsal-ventral patterning protein Sog [Planococcus citri]|uniref:dorsal-ventral patterning protein Sog n=1 Tax=Planococcus citri TaxID=170843 RepID=UPI0031FA23AB
MKFHACFPLLLAVVIVLLLETCHISCKQLLQLQEDRPHKKPHSTSECLFGKQHKEFGSTWFPDLGPPFDVMYCIRCECLKVTKDNRISGHVKCKNIAKDCQELSCEDQIQVAGRCCKVCRNDTESLAVQQDSTAVIVTEEEEKSSKHYAALLTNTFYLIHKHDAVNMSTANSLGQTATGRFTLHKKNLYYSFITSAYPLPTRPKLVQFIDNSGNIIEEQQVLPMGSVYQNLTGKVCGVWRRMPSEYRAALKEEKLNVALVWEEYDLRIQGSLMKYGPLTKEIFSSLMVSVENSLNTDSVGTAIVSISNVIPTIHIMVVFTGLLSSKRKLDDTVQLKLFSENKQMILSEGTIVVEKPSAELNIIEYTTTVSSVDLVALAQQRVTLTLSSAKYKEPKIVGKIASRVQCELFQTVLSTSHLTSSGNNKFMQIPNRASGISWMFLDKNSALQYHVVLDGISDVSVNLVTSHHSTLVEDLSSDWMKGSLKYLNPKSLEQLYREELAIHIAKINDNSSTLLQGRLTSKLIADAKDTSNPLLLKRTDTSVPADVFGLVWARIDGECSLNYDISLVGKDIDTQQYELYVEDIPFLAPGAPVARRLLEEFKGPNVEGHTFGLSQLELLRLETGVVFLDVWDKKYGQSVLRTRWEKVSIPENCLPHTTDNSTADNNIPSYRLFNDESEQPEVTKCFHGSVYYEHGTQWTSTLNVCSMCNCNRGVTKCDDIQCPALNCPQKYTVPGVCCPSCHNVTEAVTASNGCSFGGQLYPAGSAWYPYMPPNGFETCTICHCDASNFRVRCGRVDCPPLTCEEKLAFRPDKRACCKICPNKTKTIAFDVTVSDQQDPVKSEREILSAGGCKHTYGGGPYENGKEWHPHIYFHGIERCVICRCKDGSVRCNRKKCTKRSCEDECCKLKTKCIKEKNKEQASTSK